MHPSSSKSQGTTFEWDARRRRSFLTALQKWSISNGRQLPWRSCGDPYRVWLSEIMLQQTTVAAVIPYFERFLARFPTIADLASADESDVLRQWEGLGYYSRARNLHATARRVVDEHNGVFPRDLEQLRDLPGIGRYTAGAIASFAFDLPAPIVEANTLRLYSRLLGEERELKGMAAQQTLWRFAESLVGASHGARVSSSPNGFGPGAINQSLMDLGATVCTPASPNCHACPATRWCAAFANNRQHAIPRLAPRPELTDLEDATIALEQEDHFLLRRRPKGERWAGLWDFPRYTIPDGQKLADVVTTGVFEQTGLRIALGSQVTEFKHGVTRYRIRLRCFRAVVSGGQLHSDGELHWVKREDFDNFALSVTGRKFARWLQEERSRLAFD